MASRLFLTGGSGHIGREVIKQAVEQGYEVRGLSRSETSDEKIRTFGGVPVRGDLKSVDVLRQESAKADAIIHLATLYNPQFGTYDDVLEGEITAVNAMADGLAGREKSLITTSGSVVALPDPDGAETDEESPRDPNPLHTRHKLASHALSLCGRGIRVVDIRLAPIVYGHSRSGPLMVMHMAMRAGEVRCVGDGSKRTTTVHVDDAAKLYLLAAQKGRTGTYIASSNTDTTWRQILEAIAHQLALPFRAISFEEAVSQFGPGLSRLINFENRASGGKARRDLGWQPAGASLLDDINNGTYAAAARSMLSPGPTVS